MGKTTKQNQGTTPFFDERKDHHDFVKFAEKVKEGINQGKITVDDLVEALSYQKFVRLGDITKSSIYNILISNPTDKENVKRCLEAFKNMDQKDFMKRKKELEEQSGGKKKIIKDGIVEEKEKKIHKRKKKEGILGKMKKIVGGLKQSNEEKEAKEDKKIYKEKTELLHIIKNIEWIPDEQLTDKEKTKKTELIESATLLIDDKNTVRENIKKKKIEVKFFEKEIQARIKTEKKYQKKEGPKTIIKKPESIIDTPEIVIDVSKPDIDTPEPVIVEKNKNTSWKKLRKIIKPKTIEDKIKEQEEKVRKIEEKRKQIEEQIKEAEKRENT